MELYNYLLPKPREIVVLDEGAKRDFLNGKLGQQEYKILIKNAQPVIKGGSKAAIFYAKQTFVQLERLYGQGKTPDLYIHDWPEIETRGYYYDITRGKVPTLKTLKLLVDRLAEYKINQLQLYVEHTFAFEGFEEMWENATPLTANEIKTLDDYCTKRHIELVPSLSTFGHLYELLSTKKYRHLAELEDAGEWTFNWPDRMQHHTIDVSNPESIKVIKNLLDQYIPLFKSDKFNICCDETFDLGRGKNAELAKKLGKGRLYIDFLKQIIAHVKSHGKTAMFWGDILLEHPEYISEIPNDTILLNWDYAPNPSEEKISKISEGGLTQYLCPGVWSWNNLVCDIKTGYENISKMTRFAVKYKAMGVLITDWGDFGNVNSLAASIPGMIMGAAFSWNPDEITKFDQICKIISRTEYGDESEKLVSLMSTFCNLSESNAMIWIGLVHLDYINIMGKNHIWHNDHLNSMNFDEVIKKVEDTNDNYELICETIRNAQRISPEDAEEIKVSIRGLEVLLKITAQKIDNKASIRYISKSELKREKNIWLKDFSKTWLKRNKKSELFRIKEFVGRL
ncbi:MAG: beta-N-acetylhexosaminidase [Bacillota bacterium]